MELLLALIAIVITVGACVLTWRARRASHNLALEMIELRDRLAQAERAHLEAAANSAMANSAMVDPNAAATTEALAARLTAFEARVRTSMESAALEQTTPLTEGDDALDSPSMRVAKHLEQQGYTHVRVVHMDEDGRLLIEAERAGVTAKGHARLLADGRVRVQFRTSLRAFP